MSGALWRAKWEVMGNYLEDRYGTWHGTWGPPGDFWGQKKS